MKSIIKSLGTLHIRRFLSTVPKPLNPVQEAALDEQCILVDQHDQECGYASKRDCHRLVNGQIPLHRAFSVFLFNTKDELLLQQRSSTKITFPNYFTNSCCSHPLYEIEHERNTLEGAKAAACRRLSFELGIPKNQCQPKDLQYITRIRYMVINYSKICKSTFIIDVFLGTCLKVMELGANTKLIIYLFYTKM